MNNWTRYQVIELFEAIMQIKIQQMNSACLGFVHFFLIQQFLEDFAGMYSYTLTCKQGHWY